MALDPAHVQWCRNMFAMLREGGVWGIPRSGLMFRKEDGKLILYARMPWMDGMPITPEQLREQQDEELAANIEHFGAAGVEVVDGIEA